MYDTIIIGGGPAGVAAGVYAARKHLKTILIAEKIGGQSTVSDGIENWIGSVKISGTDLAKSFQTHLEAVKGEHLSLELGDRVTALTKVDGIFKVVTKGGKEFTAKSIMIASGAGRRKLKIPGADAFENKGVTYCASCDGPIFAGKDVAVIGGGNAGFETAAQLLAYAKSVTLMNHTEKFKADRTTVVKVCAHPNMRTLVNVEPTAVKGDQFVTGLVYTDRATSEEKEISVSGIFVEIGVTPNTSFLGDLVALDSVGHIIVDHRTQRASLEGIWAAGDATDQLYHQNNIAAGDGSKAIEDLYLWVRNQ